MRSLVGTVLALVGLQALVATGALAQDTASSHTVVVAIAPTASELDGPTLRAAIGAELRADAVREDDARAASAHGRFDVSVDRAAGELVVSYVGGSEPLVRRVPLPADAKAEARAIVALAGNLGRDEADDLAAQIRKANPPPPAPAPPGSDAEPSTNEGDELRLMRMLADDARRDRTGRLVTSWTLITVGAAAVTLSAVATTRSIDPRVAPLVTPLGLPAILIGIFGVPFVDANVGLTRRSRLERLSEYYPPDSETGRPWAREQVEQRWKEQGLEAHRERAALAVPLIGFGAIEMGLGAVFLATIDRHNPVDASMDISALVLGAAAGVVGIVATQGETDTESRLDEYERAVGRPIVREVTVGMAPVASGAAVGVTGRF